MLCPITPVVGFSFCFSTLMSSHNPINSVSAWPCRSSLPQRVIQLEIWLHADHADHTSAKHWTACWTLNMKSFPWSHCYIDQWRLGVCSGLLLWKAWKSSSSWDRKRLLSTINEGRSVIHSYHQVTWAFEELWKEWFSDLLDKGIYLKHTDSLNLGRTSWFSHIKQYLWAPSLLFPRALQQRNCAAYTCTGTCCSCFLRA